MERAERAAKALARAGYETTDVLEISMECDGMVQLAEGWHVAVTSHDFYLAREIGEGEDYQIAFYPPETLPAVMRRLADLAPDLTRPTVGA